MRKKDEHDVLHIPPEAVPPAPDHDAGAGHEQPPRHRAPPTLQPDGGPGGTPGADDTPRIIEPQTTPGRYPGVSVS
ncbi:hypothetical protein LZ198_05545 [Myxococcus sp. K15C18031901]|uniref:hypothetical protein n=1 Tax=Myxococcus dinghuensis TaxID=2906761 RepID=UPI0020A70E7A|nr:hypothetical protein [Myxococcus dinghuensis]MCP3098342.1 hypothetical protein [Myxococcus dinghuensis]